MIILPENMDKRRTDAGKGEEDERAVKILQFLKNAGGILAKLQGVSAVKLTAIITSVTIAAGSVGAGGRIIYDYETLPEEMEPVRVVEVAQVEEPESEEEEPVVEEEPEIEEEEEETPEVVELTLVATSIEKDLKIKIQNQNGKLVTGEQFVVTVQSDKKGSKPSTYEDKDKDGIIYISKIDAGKYTVALQEMENYVLRTASISASVKDKIEYKKVDVAAEVKKESQINAAAEDTEIKSVPVESTLKDTLPLLESKTVASKVAKSDVNAPSVAKASANGTKSVTCKKTVVQEITPTPPTPPEGGDKTPEPSPDDNKGDEGDKKDPDQGNDGTGEDQTDGNTGDGSGENSGGSVTEPDGAGADETPGTPKEDEKSIQPSQEASHRTASLAVINYFSFVQMTDRALFAAAPAAQTEGKTTETSATVSMPESIQLYESKDAASNSYKINLSISGDSSIIQKVDWNCSDETKIALSAKDGNTVTLVRKANGSADVTATVTYVTDGKGTTAKAELKCKVTASGISNSSDALKDKNGNPLYLDEKGQTVATVKDYESHDTFYTAPQYTGWQTIGGKVYYYNENHQAVTGNQVIGGVSYTFSGDGSLSQSAGNRGIDVSKYQGNIDWGAVAASGINFAIIRVGYRGSSTGVLVEDPYFKRNISGATKAGIKVGVYFFTQAITEAEAVEEASMAMSLVSGYRLSYPIFIDTESASNGRANGLSRSSRTAIVKAFCQTVQNGGYKAGVYASKSWFNNQLNASSLSSYSIWVAQYSSSCTYTGKRDLWQYSSKGKVSGISGNVDMNISYTGY